MLAVVGSRVAYLGTMIFGGLHALSSFYWGLGGRWLLDTVGQGAVAVREEAPWWIFVMLLIVGLAKVAGVLVPIANSRGLLPHPKVWRALSWLGALGLMVYGAGYMVLAHLALAGRFGEAADPRGLWGHAYIWDPLFLAWGVSLALALLLERVSTARTAPAHDQRTSGASGPP